MFEQATPCQRRGAAFVRHLTKAASLENYKASRLEWGVYSFI